MVSQNDIHREEGPVPRCCLRVLLAMGFESGLAVLALGIGWLCGHWPLVGMFGAGDLNGKLFAVAVGLMAAIPLFVALRIFDALPFAPLQRLRELVRDLLNQWLGGSSHWQLALVALSAGAGEEVLFRGLIQAGLERWIGPPWGVGVGLVVASLLFGVCHWLSTTYALLAMAAGLYFGLLMIATESLWTPLVAHAVYDFIALVYLLDPSCGRPRAA